MFCQRIRSLTSVQASANLSRYGRSMLTNLPKETTQLMIDLCTKTGAPKAHNAVNGVARNGIQKRPSQASETGSIAHVDESKGFETEDVHEHAESSLPSPRSFFPHFIDYADNFIHFLEEVATRRWGASASNQDAQDLDDKAAIWNTLLELYLTPDKRGSSTRLDKALALLRDGSASYDRSHALMLCYIRSFVPGQILIWEKLGMYEDIIRYWIDEDKENSTPDSSCSKEVLRHLDMYGPSHPHLYKLVLRYLTSSTDLLDRHRDDVVRVLDFIERENVMAPIEVVQLLSRNNVASIGLVQQWLMKRIKKGKEEVATVRCSVTPTTPIHY
jgi:hypothetical protein